MAQPSYPSLKPLSVAPRVKPKKIVPKGSIRQSDYERQQFQQAFKKATP